MIILNQNQIKFYCLLFDLIIFNEVVVLLVDAEFGAKIKFFSDGIKGDAWITASIWLFLAVLICESIALKETVSSQSFAGRQLILPDFTKFKNKQNWDRSIEDAHIDKYKTYQTFTDLATISPRRTIFMFCIIDYATLWTFARFDIHKTLFHQTDLRVTNR